MSEKAATSANRSRVVPVDDVPDIVRAEKPFLARIGIPTFLFWGFVGTLIFMIGDGIGSASLSPFLVKGGIGEQSVAILFTVSPSRLGVACGWFWFAFTGGLPTLGSVFARISIPIVGAYTTLWLALATVCIGAVVALFGLRDDRDSFVEHKPGYSPLRTLFSSLSIVRDHPEVGLGSIVRAINTAAEFGLLVMLPIYFTKTLHFTLAQWLEVTACIFTSNIIGNLLSGIVSDWLSWRRTIMFIGGVGSAISTILLYEVPTHLGPDGMLLTMCAGGFYGVTLAGCVPLSALMPYLAPENKPAAMSMPNLGAGMSVWIGPAIVAAFLSTIGVFGVMCIYSGTYLISAVIAHFLTLALEVQAEVDADKAAGRVVADH